MGSPYATTTYRTLYLDYPVTRFCETCLDCDVSTFDESAHWWKAEIISTYNEKTQPVKVKRTNKKLRQIRQKTRNSTFMG